MIARLADVSWISDYCNAAPLDRDDWTELCDVCEVRSIPSEYDDAEWTQADLEAIGENILGNMSGLDWTPEALEWVEQFAKHLIDPD